MDQPEITAALTTLGWLELIKRIGGFMVIAGVAIEVGGDWWATPLHKKVDDARTLQLEQLKKDSAEAELALGKINAQLRGRVIDKKKILTASEGVSKVPVEIRFIRADTEAYILARQFFDALKSAQWQVSEPMPISAEDMAKFSKDRPPAISDAPPTGVSVITRVDTPQELMRFGISPKIAGAPNGKRAPWIVLADVAMAGLGPGWVNMFAATPDTKAPPKGTLLLLIGPKP